MKICIADDEKQVRESIIQKIKSVEPRADIYDVGFGEQALEQIAMVRPDLAFLDIRMPEKDGLDILRAVRQRSPRTVVAMLSGYSDFEYARSAIQLGAIDYLLKPADREQLREVILKVKLAQQSAFVKELESYLSPLAGQFIYVHDIEAYELSSWYDERRAKTVGFADGTETPPADRPVTSGSEKELIGSFGVNRSYTVKVSAKGEQDEGPFFYGKDEFVPYLLNRLDRWETRRFFGERQQRQQERHGQDKAGAIKLAVQLRRELAGMARDDVQAKYSELEAVFAKWLVCLETLELKPLRKEAAALMAVLDEGMTDKRQWVVVDEDKLHYWSEWVHKFGTWDELRQTVTRFVLGGIRALLLLERQPPASTGWLEQAMRRVHSSPVALVSLDSVAAEVGVHPVTLSRMFKQHTGVNFVRFLIRRRLEVAQSRLLTTNKPIADIAEEVGYQDYRHFRSQFKKEFGMTPGEYRTQNGVPVAEESE